MTLFFELEKKKIPIVLINLCKKFYDDQEYYFDFTNEDNFINRIIKKGETHLKLFPEDGNFDIKKCNMDDPIIKNSILNKTYIYMKTGINGIHSYSISEYILLKYKNFIDKNEILKILECSDVKYSYKLYDAFKNIINWESACSRIYINEYIYINYIMKYAKNIDISTNSRLDIDFMVKYKKKINWTHISDTRTLEIKEIEILDKFLDWKNMSWQKLNAKLIEKHHDKIIVEKYIECHDNISLDEFKMLYKYNKNYFNNIGSEIFTELLMNKCNNNINDIIREFSKIICFHTISQMNLELDINIYLDFNNKFLWNEISRYHRLNKKARELLTDKINWHIYKSENYYDATCNEESMWWA